MTAPLRVLLAEDSPTDAKLVAAALKGTGRAVTCERVQTAEAMRAALAGGDWDAVISDWSMPGFGALPALAILRESGRDLPFIIVSGTIGEERAVEAMRAGAHDFVLKDGLARLAPALERELRECADRAARRVAEAALKAQEARFRALIEKSEEGISLTARDGTTLYRSPAADRIFGYGPDDEIGRSGFVRMHPDDRAAVEASLARITAVPGATGTIEFRVVDADGSYRWVEGTGTNMLDDPAVGAVIGNFRDVSARKRALDALRASEQRYRRIVETTNEGVWAFDADERVSFVNARIVSMLGYDDAGQMLGLHIDAFLHADERAATHARNKLWREGVGSQVEVPLRRRDGLFVWVLVESTPVFDADGRYEGVLAMGMDLTARRDLESQLRHAQKMEAVGRLAGGVAHDFNNLLSVILGYAELALDDMDDDAPLRVDLEEIRTAGERAEALTRQLLMFSRQQVIAPRVIDLGELVAGMEKMLGRLVGEDVEVVTRAVRSLGRVRVDPSSMDQVVMNLVVNARDAMPTGGRLTIETADVVLDAEYARAHHGVEPGPHVMLAVGDTGTGMDEATIARIFEPFFTTKEQGKGTGLGLSTVFGIVQQSQGSVDVDSAPGRGTTFKVYLPTVDAAIDAPCPSIAPGPRHGTETILLVEDEDAVRAVARNILRRHGYEVIEARSAGEALLRCERESGAIDLLLTDVVMPQMSGPELAQRLCQMRPALRVLCMSGYTDDSVVRHGVLAASLAYLQKPLTPELLTRRVREVLDAP